MKRAGLLFVAVLFAALFGLVLLGKKAHAAVLAPPPAPPPFTPPGGLSGWNGPVAPPSPDVGQIAAKVGTGAAVAAAAGLVKAGITAGATALGGVEGGAVAAIPAVASVAVPVAVAAVFAYNIAAAMGLVGESQAQKLAQARDYAANSLYVAGAAGVPIREVDKAIPATMPAGPLGGARHNIP